MCACHADSVGGRGQLSGVSLLPWFQGLKLRSSDVVTQKCFYCLCRLTSSPVCLCIYLCGGMCAGVRRLLVSFRSQVSLSEAAHRCFETISQPGARQLDWAGQQAPGSYLSPPPAAGIKSMCPRGWIFLHGCWDLNSVFMLAGQMLSWLSSFPSLLLLHIIQRPEFKPLLNFLTGCHYLLSSCAFQIALIFINIHNQVTEVVKIPWLYSLEGTGWRQGDYSEPYNQACYLGSYLCLILFTYLILLLVISFWLLINVIS